MRCVTDPRCPKHPTMAVFEMFSEKAQPYARAPTVWRCLVCNRELGVASLNECGGESWATRPPKRAMPPASMSSEATDWRWVHDHRYEREQVRRMLALAEAFDGSASLQAGAIMGLLTVDNIDVMIRAMPRSVRYPFLDWCRKLRDGGPPLGEWDAEFARGFEAVCDWFDRGARGAVLWFEHLMADPAKKARIDRVVAEATREVGR